MGKENDTWIMRGVSSEDPACLHTAEEAVRYIEEIGFLPLFRNGIPGFSLEERTDPEFWWSGDPLRDPWEWRAVIARSKKVAYGKFFERKAGFISMKWLPYFISFRRDGYDFDALWDDELASIRQKKIMDLFTGEKKEFFSYELKAEAGFGGKEGEKGFETVLQSLQMELYLCVTDFRQKISKRGVPYGWSVAVYSTPEELWGCETVKKAYLTEPEEAEEKIIGQMKKRFPEANEKEIRKITGGKILPGL